MSHSSATKPSESDVSMSIERRDISQNIIADYFVFQNRFAYKDEYEKFKLYMTIILMFGAVTCLFLFNYR